MTATRDRRWRGRLGSQQGSAPIEAAIVVPPLLMLLCLALAGGRLVLAGAKVDAAAQDAVREASIHRTPAAARAAARKAATQSLTDQGVTCASSSIRIDTNGLAVPVGQVSTVTATVSCTVNLSDLLLPGTPGSRTLTATATSVVDRYRERALGPARPHGPRSVNHKARAEP